MKAIIRDFTVSFILGFVIPWALLLTAVAASRTEFACSKGSPTENGKVFRTSGNLVLLHREAQTEKADLDVYLTGVVLAEMPADFSEEALKAQAIAARTYARKAYETGGKHENGGVCTDSGCCQAFLTLEQYLQRGGTVYGAQKIAQAVKDTSGLVLVYEGSLIEATYFSCSGGKTENALEVWGTDYPYLQSVESPGEEAALYYRDVIYYTPDTVAGRLEIPPEEPPEKWITLTEYTNGGSVRQMVIGGVTFTGTQLRSLLGLRSAAFDMEFENGQFKITTQGYGHRVGMSQYGAEAMAQSGAGYTEILNHYYPGTELAQLEPDYTQGICHKMLF